MIDLLGRRLNLTSWIKPKPVMVQYSRQNCAYRVVKVLVMLFVLINSSAVYSFADKDVKTYHFNIQAGDLAVSLCIFSEITNTEFSYPSAMVEDLKADKLIGEFTEEQALEKLLGNTGITYRVVDDRIIVLETLRYESLKTESLFALIWFF